MRNYWTNLPLPPNLPGIRDAPETAVQHFLKNAIAPFVKTGVSGLFLMTLVPVQEILMFSVLCHESPFQEVDCLDSKHGFNER